MTYELLSESLKLAYMTNFEFFGKSFILLCLLVMSLYYLYIGKDEDKMQYIISDKIEMGKLILSKIFLFTFPLWIFVLFPSVKIDKMILLLAYLYMIFIIMGAIVGMIGFLYYGTTWILKYAGLDITRKADQDVMRKIDSYLPANSEFQFNKNYNLRNGKKKSNN